GRGWQARIAAAGALAPHIGSAIRDPAQQNTQRLLAPAIANYGRLIEETGQLLTVISRLPEVRDRNGPATGRLFRDLLKRYPLYSNLGGILPDGTVFASGLPLRGPLNLKDRLYFRRAIETRNFTIGEFQIGRITGKTSINCGYPVFDEQGKVTAVVFAALDLGWLNQYAAQARLPRQSVLAILDHTGTLLVRYPDGARWVGKPITESQLAQRIFTQQTGSATLHGPDGVERLYVYAPLNPDKHTEQVYLYIGIPTSMVFASANRILARNLALLFLMGLLTLLVGWIGSDRVLLRRIDSLVHITKQLSAGDLSARTALPRGRDELDQLAHAFDEMAGSLQGAQQQLLAAEAEKKQFMREVVLAVTEGKFHLVDADEIPTVGQPVVTIALEEAGSYRALRHRLQEIAVNAGITPEAAAEMVLAVGEASTNAVKHAGGGQCTIYVSPDRVVARVRDQGPGIRPENLAGTLLQPGFSTKISLGMGYTLMLELMDILWLATSSEGTVVQLEKWIHPEEHQEGKLPASWERL
ncbi:MAG TPA: cache domain-containing protein, partial [Armatimonadota bacterium]|nr:cache domain-containing protein [Armatimonadota bacterium]